MGGLPPPISPSPGTPGGQSVLPNLSPMVVGPFCRDFWLPKSVLRRFEVVSDTICLLRRFATSKKMIFQRSEPSKIMSLPYENHGFQIIIDSALDLQKHPQCPFHSSQIQGPEGPQAASGPLLRPSRSVSDHFWPPGRARVPKLACLRAPGTDFD